MTFTKPYPKAPITEAIIDLRVEPRAELSLEELEGVRIGEEARYPRLNKIFQTEGTITVQDGVPPSATAQHQLLGYRFTSEDGKAIWQSRRDGFTFSQLAPYASWEPFRDEARRLWMLFRDRSAPVAVERLAVRYINRIDIPSPSIDLKDYFRTSPEISPDLPQSLAGFFMQLSIPQSDLCGQALINQTIIPQSRDDVVSVVLDIDLIRAADVPNTEDAIWDLFEKLRVRKNEVFEACITDTTRRLFE